MEVIYINDIKGSMSDNSIIELGHKLGGIPIITANPRHFQYYDNLIPLKSKNKVKKLIAETLKYLK